MSDVIKPTLAEGHSIDPIQRLQETKDLGETARNFEAVFLSLMVKEMRKSIPGLFGKMPGSHVYEGLFDQMLGESMAAGEGIGLRRQLLDSFEQFESRSAPKVLDRSI